MPTENGEVMVPIGDVEDGSAKEGSPSAIANLVVLLDFATAQGAMLRLPKFVRLLISARSELLESTSAQLPAKRSVLAKGDAQARRSGV